MNTQPRHPKCRALPVEPHPDIHFPAMIPRRGVKIKFFLSVVIYVVKADFIPLSAIVEIPQTQVPQGFAAFRLTLSRIQPRHSQSKRATNCAAPPKLYYFLPACLARPACGSRKNPRAVRLLDFFDRGACSASLHPPPDLRPAPPLFPRKKPAPGADFSFWSE